MELRDIKDIGVQSPKKEAQDYRPGTFVQNAKLLESHLYLGCPAVEF